MLARWNDLWEPLAAHLGHWPAIAAVAGLALVLVSAVIAICRRLFGLARSIANRYLIAGALGGTALASPKTVIPGAAHLLDAALHLIRSIF